MAKLTNKPFDIHEAIAQAKASVKELKQTHPYIYPQWQELKAAEQALKEAQARLERAQDAWDNLGGT